MTTSPDIDTVVFDLGGVLVDWDPRYLYRKLLPDDESVERFLADVCTQAWNEEQDRGRPLAEGTAMLVDKHPMHRELIEAFYGRWGEMLAGEVAGTRAVVDDVRRSGRRVLALSNWSAETFPVATERFPFLEALFDGVVLSGREGLKKPDPAIFHLLCTRYEVTPGRALFIDDVDRNVAAAREVGLHALRFLDASTLRRQLASLGVVSE